jgi:hypothetical protein
VQFGFELAEFLLWLLIEFPKNFHSRFRDINFDFLSSLYVLVNSSNMLNSSVSIRWHQFQLCQVHQVKMLSMKHSSLPYWAEPSSDWWCPFRPSPEEDLAMILP